jgi:hypothetical protein
LHGPTITTSEMSKDEAKNLLTKFEAAINKVPL